jgi:Skp family chaperone for outer membrane proteins
MRHLKGMLSAGVALIALTAAPASRAQWAVVDVGAITQLIQEVNYWKQQIQAMSSQLNQLQNTYSAMTGNRGMQNVLPMTPLMRNYLPPDWAGLMAALAGLNRSYGVLGTQLNSALTTNAILTPAQVSRLSPQEQAQLQSSRNSAALMQATSQQSLQSAGQRFTSLQQLINAIPTATDQKGALDLHARIAAEQAMLENEQAKIQSLNQALEADERARQQRAQELSISNLGSLRTTPPIGLN